MMMVNKNFLFILFFITTTVTAFCQYSGGARQRDEDERLRHKKLISAADIVSCEVYSVSCNDGVYQEPGSLSNELTFDKNGNPLLETRHNLDGGMNTVYTYQYDSSDRIIYESFGNDKGKIISSTQYYYSKSGKLEKEKVTDPGAKFSVYYRTYSYSIVGILLLETITDTLNHILKQVEYDCNNNGLLMAQKEKRADGSAIFSTNYKYDKQNRLILTNEEDKDGVAGDEIKYSYDKNGNLVHEEYVSKFGQTYLEYLYEYNSKGRLIRLQENNPQDGSTNITKYTYNDFGLLASEVWFDKALKPLDRIDYYYKTR